MDSRLELQKKLEAILGNKNVYFQPPESFKIKYPCIIYKLDGDDVSYANNKMYYRFKQYSVIYIDKDPDSTKPDELVNFPMCRLEREYTADNLHHWAFIIFY